MSERFKILVNGVCRDMNDAEADRFAAVMAAAEKRREAEENDSTAPAEKYPTTVELSAELAALRAVIELLISGSAAEALAKLKQI